MRLFTDADAQINTHSYPATAAELTEAYGDLELTFSNGSETFGDAMARIEGETTFQDSEAARLCAYSAVCEKAIGRKNYSDRDGFAPGEDGPEMVSF